MEYQGRLRQSVVNGKSYARYRYCALVVDAVIMAAQAHRLIDRLSEEDVDVVEGWERAIVCICRTSNDIGSI